MKGTDMRKRFRENWKILSAAAAGVLVMILAVLLTPGKIAIGKIQRDTYGGAVKTVTLYVQTDGEEEQAVEIQVSPRKYSRTELEALAGQAARRLDTVLPGENKSLDYVVSDLVLPGSLEGLPFRITWELSRYDVLDMEGKIQEEELEKEDTDDGGVLVTLTGILRYEDFETAYSTSARICKPEEKNQNFSELVQSVIQKEDEASSENAWLVLPKEIEGKKIIWKREEENTAVPAAGILLLSALLLRLRKKQKQKDQEKEREKQMLLDYPEIISQVTMLLQTGMTVRNVWKRVTEDYLEQKKKSGRERAAYEEMVTAWKEMQGGMPEQESYERFARRCRLAPYMKFGAVLAQNLRKGAKGTADILSVEAIQAMEDRKSRAKQFGEEAGTKLLGPMFLMLVVVLLMVVVPAFWSVQI